MKPIDRRTFLATSLAGVAATSLSSAFAAETKTAPGIIDTNINLFDWPFRRLKYRDTKALVAKLKKHRVTQAWAGSFEALFSKDINGVNERLAAECKQHRGFLIPFGAVNLAWPDWQEDLRRCHEIHKMPGIRIYPGYQPFDLAHPDIESLLKMTAQHDLILQIVFGMEDPRVFHPIINVAPVTLRPLFKNLQSTPNAKIQLLHFPNTPQGDDLAQFLKYPNTCVENSRFEGNGAIARMLGTMEGLASARASIDRILFGSHAPYFPIETAILKLIESPLDLAQIDAITNRNARRLLPV
jgi:predicted TIM-barrel fold metal-dependent hydrolase